MASETRRARSLACLLDLLIPAAIADVIALTLTAAVWVLAPGIRGETPWFWAGAAAATLLAFLLRDARGGRARRWMALEIRDRLHRPPGPWASIRRNLPLLIPGWNLVEAWPVLREGTAARPSDRRLGLEMVPFD
jgi:hypothetical protein